jgi:general secretion pathway protein A
LTYVSQFGLSESPFSITPDPRFLYMSARHREALAHLLYGITGAGGFVQLTGEVGTGKTTISRYLLEQLPPDVDVALILNPKLTALELLASVCDELRIPYPNGTPSLKVLVDALYRHLLGAHSRARRTALVIDEAQNLTAEVLEQIRLLTNLETTREKLLQIILIGQPELSQMLDRPELRQLAQRVTARYHLLPFSAPETRGYILHRMEVGGQRKVAFTDAAMREVHRLSGGVPRLINAICDRALLGAHAHDLTRIEPRTLRAAATEVLGRPVRPRYVMPAVWSAAALGVVALGAAGWAMRSGPDDTRLAAMSQPTASVPVAASPVTRIVPAEARTGADERNARAAEPRTGDVPRQAGAAEARTGATDTQAGATENRAGAADARASLPTSTDAGPRSRLGEILADASLRGDRQSAFATLYARWGVTYDGRTDAPCDGARPDGIECLSRTATWTRLRGLGLPAIIELTTRTGAKRYATLTALGPRTATLQFGDRTFTAALDEIEPFWKGESIALWKPPSSGVVWIGPGGRAKDIEWLRQRLAAIDGRPLPTTRADVYDDPLRERVIAFQRSRALVPDGIAGAETLTHLSTALRDSTIPVLGSPRP